MQFWARGRPTTQSHAQIANPRAPGYQAAERLRMQFWHADALRLRILVRLATRTQKGAQNAILWARGPGARNRAQTAKL
eukprot:1733916-Pyramimonas_sp.AAC.1